VTASRATTLPLYVGGFLGPFGAGVLAVLIPQLRDAFDATTAEIALAVPAYMVPFAALQLVSGTIGERLGRRRVVRAGYVGYAAASVALALSPGIPAFLTFRALQGVANAFLTPLLLAGLADEVPRRQLGRAVGTFAAVQTAAVALSPLCGGLLGALDWRLAFVVPAGVAVVLALFPPTAPRAAGAAAARARLRSVVSVRVGLLCGASFAGYAGITGLPFLVAVLAGDHFGLASITRGLVVATFGVSGMLCGRAAGDLVDRFGRVRIAMAGAVACALLVGALGFAPGPTALAALWFGAGAASALVWAGINTLVVEAVPQNRAGGTSVASAFKFAGSAAAPIMWLPLYHADARLGFLGAGVMALLSGLLVLPLRSVA
jgi:MFS family permease